MNAAGQRRLTPFLVVLAVLLAALLLLLFVGVGRQVHWHAPRTLAPLPPAGSAAGLPRPLPLQHFAEVWQAPLFNPDRRPLSQASAEGSNLGDLELTGVILTPGMHMALLHDKQADKDLRLKQGESLPDGSVTLVEVHARSAVFDSSSGRAELKLPAGAPIDLLKNTEDDNRDDNRGDNGRPPPSRSTPSGAGMRRVQPAGNNPQPGGTERGARRPADEHSPAAILNRLRQLRQHRQQGHSQAGAATHSKE